MGNCQIITSNYQNYLNTFIKFEICTNTPWFMAGKSVPQFTRRPWPCTVLPLCTLHSNQVLLYYSQWPAVHWGRPAGLCGGDIKNTGFQRMSTFMILQTSKIVW